MESCRTSLQFPLPSRGGAMSGALTDLELPSAVRRAAAWFDRWL